MTTTATPSRPAAHGDTLLPAHGRPTPATATFRVVALTRFPLRLAFRPRVSGLEHVPHGGAVLAANQVSNLDGFAVGCVLYPRRTTWLGKAELFVPVLAPLLRRLGIVPVDRGKGDLAAIETAVLRARAGDAVGIFPEGTRREKGFRKSRSPEPHTGAARIALAADVPLVPVAIVGTERLTRLRRWRVAFGPSLPLDGLPPHPRKAARELTRRLMAAISGLETSLRDEAARSKRRLHPRHRIDIGAGDLAAALAATCVARRRGREQRVLGAWSGGESAVVCLSVRTAFDLLLTALALDPGDEIVFSAITHPDMIRIAEAHGLRIVPVDLDTETLAPRLDLVGEAVGPRTRMIVVAHLFGSRVDLAPLRAAADEHGLLLVEDCAQAFRGPHVAGDPLADVSLWSFGAIKTATALGGALVRIPDDALRAQLAELNARLPVQRRSAYARRAVRFLGLLILTRPRVYALLALGLERTGRNLDLVNGAVRGFPAESLLTAIRQRPSAPLLAVLERRLRRFDERRLARRAEVGEVVARALPLEIPGRAAADRTHWVLPVVTTDSDALVAHLRRNGFDASKRTSAIQVVPAPAERPDLQPVAASRLMDGIVFLPAHPDLGRDIDRLVRAVGR